MSLDEIFIGRLALSNDINQAMMVYVVETVVGFFDRGLGSVGFDGRQVWFSSDDPQVGGSGGFSSSMCRSVCVFDTFLRCDTSFELVCIGPLLDLCVSLKFYVVGFVV